MVTTTDSSTSNVVQSTTLESATSSTNAINYKGKVNNEAVNNSNTVRVIDNLHQPSNVSSTLSHKTFTSMLAGLTQISGMRLMKMMASTSQRMKTTMIQKITQMKSRGLNKIRLRSLV